MAKKQYKDGQNYLDLIPVQNPTLTWDQNEEGIVTIYIENKGFFHKIAQLLFKKPKISQVHLEEMGSFIYPLCDGTHSVNDIALKVKEKYGEKAEPLYDRLVTYMHNLETYDFIKMKVS